MKDLMIRYENTSGKKIYVEYDTIMGFIDDVDSDRPSIPMHDCENIAADFFENPLLHKRFKNITELIEHCKKIVR